MNIKVKPLVWVQIDEWTRTAAGYRIHKAPFESRYHLYLTGHLISFGYSAETLMDDAQAHHEDRILSAIDVEATEAAIRADERAEVLGEVIPRAFTEIATDWSGYISERSSKKAGKFDDWLESLHTPESRAIAEGEA